MATEQAKEEHACRTKKYFTRFLNTFRVTLLRELVYCHYSFLVAQAQSNISIKRQISLAYFSVNMFRHTYAIFSTE